MIGQTMTTEAVNLLFWLSETAGTAAANAAPAPSSSIVQTLMASHIDLMTLFLVLFLGAVGAFTGAIRQISNIAALVTAYFASNPCAAKIAPPVAAALSAPLFLATVACCIVSFFLVYAASYVLYRMLLKRIIPEGENGMIDKMGGFLLGGGKAAAIMFVILSALVLIEPGVRSHWDRFAQEEQHSRAYRFARENSIFARMTQFQTLQTVMMASGSRADPRTADALAQLAADPDLAALAKNPRIAAIAADHDIQRALFSGNYPALFANDKVRELLNDRELFDELGRVRAKVTAQMLDNSDTSGGGQAASSEKSASQPQQRSRAEEIEAMQ